MFEWAAPISAGVAVAVFLFGVFKWYSTIQNEREYLKTMASEERQKKITDILNEHKQEFARMGKHIENVERELLATRDEMHKDYAKTDRVDSLRMEFKDDFGKVFKRLSSISEGLNRLIGTIGGNNGTS